MTRRSLAFGRFLRTAHFQVRALRQGSVRLKGGLSTSRDLLDCFGVSVERVLSWGVVAVQLGA